MTCIFDKQFNCYLPVNLSTHNSCSTFHVAHSSDSFPHDFPYHSHTTTQPYTTWRCIFIQIYFVVFVIMLTLKTVSSGASNLFASGFWWLFQFDGAEVEGESEQNGKTVSNFSHNWPKATNKELQLQSVLLFMAFLIASSICPSVYTLFGPCVVKTLAKNTTNCCTQLMLLK